MKDLTLNRAIDLAERGLAPDLAIRLAIRRLHAARLDIGERDGVEGTRDKQRALMAEMNAGPIALHTEKANEQHYEVPAQLYQLCLGPRLKYSCGLWPPGVASLARAEEAMLDLYVERAGLADGMTVLDLGCGWGSLTLYLAERFPGSRIVGISNSASQRQYVLEQAGKRGLDNVEVETHDVNDLELEPESFDRICSIEMFEHVRNHRELLRRIAGWLKPDGKLFVHIFVHREQCYPFEVEGADNWLGRHFFTGGLMPSDDLLLHHQDDLRLEERWAVNGQHYARTAAAWLASLDANREAALALFRRDHAEPEALRWVGRWRMFFMACEELWGYRGGREWYVSHYRFARR